MAVAEFYAEFMQRLRRLGIEVHIWTTPSEIENAVPFERDHRTRSTIRPLSKPKVLARLGAGKPRAE